MALFGSTSPSYLTLASLDGCNRYLEEGYPARLARTAAHLDGVRAQLRVQGWQVERSDPLRITVAAPRGMSGTDLASRLRRGGVECEYADPAFLVAMATPETPEKDFDRLVSALGTNPAPAAEKQCLPLVRGERACSVREALFAPHETVSVEAALGRICAAPTVACPPAIPIAVSGERIGEEALALFRHYGIADVDVIKE